MTRTPGLPPDNASGVFIGFDADEMPYVLTWVSDHGCWAGAGFQYPQDDIRPFVFLARQEMAGFVVSHCEVRR